MCDYTTLEEQVEYGLDTIAPERTVEVPLQDLLYVYQVFGELVRFFHQPLHHADLASLECFLGSRDQGMIHLLFECYYDKLRDVWPADIQEQIEDVVFDNPKPPFYFKPKDNPH